MLKKSSFAQCWNLKNIIIPSSMKAIYQNAFQGCNQLEYVKVLPTNPPSLFDDSFSNFSVPLRVPKGCKEIYQTAQGWRKFNNILEDDPMWVRSVKSNNVNVVKRYTVDGRMTNDAQSGIDIIKMNNGKTKKIIRK